MATLPQTTDALRHEAIVIQDAARRVAECMVAAIEPVREANAEIKRLRDAEKMVSDAYLRLRTLIPGALDTPYGPSPEQVYETTENALRRALAKPPN